jgi:hydrogenase-1 operon protein HyaF
MSGLDSIGIKAEHGVYRTENLRPLLLQVAQALEDLVERDEPTTIDLGAMPFSAQDESDLRAWLGAGEVKAEVQAFGLTLIEETGVRGVWLVEMKDVEDKRLTLHIEIARVPALVATPSEDLREGLDELRNRITSDAADHPSH